MLIVGVPEKNQKLMFKGLLRDDQTLGSAGITKGAKLMVVGSKPNDIIAVTSVTKQVVIYFNYEMLLNTESTLLLGI